MAPRIALASLLVVGLGGCASTVVPRPVVGPHVGEFTGEYVEGRPLYRFPAIEVVGSRRRLGQGS